MYYLKKPYNLIWWTSLVVFAVAAALFPTTPEACAQPVSTPVRLSELIASQGFIESQKFRFDQFHLDDSSVFPTNLSPQDVLIDIVNRGGFEGIAFIPINDAFTPPAGAFRDGYFSFVVRSLADNETLAATRVEIDGMR